MSFGIQGVAHERHTAIAGLSPASSMADAPHTAMLNFPRSLGCSFAGGPSIRVPSGILRVWHPAQLISPRASPFGVGIHRRIRQRPVAPHADVRALERFGGSNRGNRFWIEHTERWNVV